MQNIEKFNFNRPFYRIRPLKILIIFLLACLSLAAILWFRAIQNNLKQETSVAILDKQIALESFNGRPTLFSPNRGQFDKKVKYYSKGSGYDFFLENGAVSYLFSRDTEGQPEGDKTIGNETARPQEQDLYALKIAFSGANNNAVIEGIQPSRTKLNYMIGNDRSKWNINVPTFNGVRYKNLYSGIDLAYVADGKDIKYEFVVSPNADPGQIKLSYAGVKSLKVSKKGDLLIDTAWGSLKDDKPFVYQMIAGQKVEIDSIYMVKGKTVSFKLGQYNPSIPLVIDPKLAYSTFIGGGARDRILAMDIDSSGNVFVTGITLSQNFPVQAGAFDNTFSAGATSSDNDGFIAKLSADGSTLEYATYVGGAGGDYYGTGQDEPHSIKVDSNGNVHVAGFTSCSGFPVTAGAYDTSYNNNVDVFYLELNSSGNGLINSTFVGSNAYDDARDIVLDDDGNAYITGKTESVNFPTTAGAFDTTHNGSFQDAFVLKLNANASALLYSTFLGGASEESGNRIKLDSDKNAYIIGETNSAGFPTTAGAYDTSQNGAKDVFLSKLSADGSALSFSTFLGSPGEDIGHDIELGTSGDIIIAGSAATPAFPTTAGAYDTSFNWGSPDGFVAKFNSAGTSLAYSTFLGGNDADKAYGVEVDSDGSMFVVGTTVSSTFPVTGGSHDTSYEATDIFMTKLNPAGNALLYSTFLGGSGTEDNPSIRVDSQLSAIVAGSTFSPNFPSTTNAYDKTKNGNYDGFVTKFILPEMTSIDINPQTPNGSNGWYKTPVTVSLSRNVAGTTYYKWNSGSWNTYTSAMSVAQGQNTLSYYSVAGGVTESVSQETFKIDTEIPTDPSAASASHGEGELSKNRIVTINLTGQFDGVSGLDGFSVVWDQLPTTLPGASRNTPNKTSIRSPSLADGSWYFHLRTVDIAGNWTSTVHLGPFEISVAKPHGGYSSATNKCKVCHLVHGGSNTSYKLLRNGDVTEPRSSGEGNVAGMGNAKATMCMFCHDASSGFTAKRPYELSALGVSVKGEHRIGATVIPDSNLTLANRDPLGEGAVLQCYQCHSVHGSQTIGQDSDGDGNLDQAYDGNVYDGDDSIDSWNTKILRLDPAGDGSILGTGEGGLSSAAWQQQLLTSPIAVKTGFCADCHNKNINWLTSNDDSTNRVNPSSHPQGPGADGLMTVGNQQNTIVARHLTVRQGCRGCHSATSGPEATSRFPHQSVGWRLLYDKYTVSFGGDPAQGIPQMDRVCMRCHSVTNTLQTGSYAQNEEKICFTCHGIVTNNPEAPNVEAELLKASHHPTSDTIGKHTEGEQDDPGKLGSTNRHAECVDCHSVSSVTQDGTNPLRGAWGVSPLNGAIGTSPTFTKVATITKQYQLCFKCHSSYTDQIDSNYYKDNSGNARTQGNKALEFNTNNSSFHPVEAAGRNRSEALKRQLEAAGLTTTSIIKCTDCHNSDSAGDVQGVAANSGFRPKGPHGSTFAPVLRKNYKTNNYPLLNGYEVNNFDLCFLCHDQTKLGGMSDYATNFSSDEPGYEFNHHFMHLQFIETIFGFPTPLCRSCHYNVHSNQQAINTEYVVRWQGSSTWSYYQSPPEGLKTRLINFAPFPAMRGRAPATKPQWIVNLDTTTHAFNGEDFGPRQRGCNLDCHFRSSYYQMGNRRYRPPVAFDTDPLTY